MALYRDPKTVILEVIERDNPDVGTLIHDDYDVTNPIPVTPPQGSSASYNTQVTVAANTVAAAYQGEYEFYYNRLLLEDLASMVDLKIHAPDATTTYDVIGPLNRRFGTNFTEADLEDHPFVDMGGFFEVLLEAKSDSLGWIGQATLIVYEGGVDLSVHLDETELPGLRYPTDYPTKTFASIYSYWRDFTEHFAYLSTVKAGDPITFDLVSILGDVTGDPWQASGFADYSLGRAEILLAERTEDSVMEGVKGVIGNTDYEFVIVIALHVDDAQAMTGNLILHFNDPASASVI